jgi:hypothetical protein
MSRQPAPTAGRDVYLIRGRVDDQPELLHAGAIEEVRQRAEAYGRDYGIDSEDLADGSIYVDVRVYQHAGACADPDAHYDECGEYLEHDGEHFALLETVVVAHHQAEPACPGGEHEWANPLEVVGGIPENPGVSGNGGGVTIREVCMRCGCERRTDTWAQRRDTGEQGLTETTYQPNEHADGVRSLYTAVAEWLAPGAGARPEAWSWETPNRVLATTRERDSGGEWLIDPEPPYEAILGDRFGLLLAIPDPQEDGDD